MKKYEKPVVEMIEVQIEEEIAAPIDAGLGDESGGEDW